MWAETAGFSGAHPDHARRLGRRAILNFRSFESTLFVLSIQLRCCCLYQTFHCATVCVCRGQHQRMSPIEARCHWRDIVVICRQWQIQELVVGDNLSSFLPIWYPPSRGRGECRELPMCLPVVKHFLMHFESLLVVSVCRTYAHITSK